MIKTYNDDRIARMEQWTHHRILQSKMSTASEPEKRVIKSLIIKLIDYVLR